MLKMKLKDYFMAHNFKIFMHQTADNLNIDLLGDFDGSSAFELINLLKDNLNSAKRIFIDTKNLKKIYPFGQEVFNWNFSKLRDHRINIQFVGSNAFQIVTSWFHLINEVTTTKDMMHEEKGYERGQKWGPIRKEEHMSAWAILHPLCFHISTKNLILMLKYLIIAWEAFVLNQIFPSNQEQPSSLE